MRVSGREIGCAIMRDTELYHATAHRVMLTVKEPDLRRRIWGAHLEVCVEHGCQVQSVR